jgi:hypothetical protein
MLLFRVVPGSVITWAEIAEYLDVPTIAYEQCDRRVRPRVERLVAEHRGDASSYACWWGTIRTATTAKASDATLTSWTWARCLLWSGAVPR